MIDFATVRDQFPGVNQRRDGLVPIFFDGPAGTQVPEPVSYTHLRAHET